MMLKIDKSILHIFQGIEELIEIYKEIDSIIERFKKTTGIDCLKGCGKCCEIPSWKVETTVFELIPLAIHLWNVNEAEIFLDWILKTEKDDFCIFYKKNFNNNGCCYVYSFRPLICRLFGFSAIKNKYGELIPILCSIIKKEDLNRFEKIKQMLKKGLEIPINSLYAGRIKMISPIYGKDLYPINEATKIAIEMVGYRLRLLNNKGDEFEPTQSYKKAA